MCSAFSSIDGYRLLLPVDYDFHGILRHAAKKVCIIPVVCHYKRVRSPTSTSSVLYCSVQYEYVPTCVASGDKEFCEVPVEARCVGLAHVVSRSTRQCVRDGCIQPAGGHAGEGSCDIPVGAQGRVWLA